MKYIYIPGTDLNASCICFGTSALGGIIPEKESFELLDIFLDRGGNLLDTALVYTDFSSNMESASEKAIGTWMKKRKNRSQIVLGTKGGCPNLTTLHISRLSPDEIIHDLDQSLKNLQTDYIDIYWLHRDDPKKPVDEIIGVLNEQVECGKIRCFGCSNWKAERVEEAYNYAQAAGCRGFSANQLMWSLAEVNYENLPDKTMVVMDQKEKAFHKRTGMGVFAYSSQAGGFFSGKYHCENPQRNPGITQLYYSDSNFARFDRTKEVAASLGKTATQVAVAYLLSQPFRVFPIIGCHTPAQLLESCQAGGLTLDAGAVEYLENEKCDG